MDMLHSKIIIPYSAKHLRNSLIFGILWLVIGLLDIVFTEPFWTAYGFLLIGFLYLGSYAYMKIFKYITIDNGYIWGNKPFTKKINLSEIKTIKKFAGDYTLTTDHHQLKIHTGIVDPGSLAKLDAELTKIAVAAG